MNNTRLQEETFLTSEFEFFRYVGLCEKKFRKLLVELDLRQLEKSCNNKNEILEVVFIVNFLRRSIEESLKG